MELHGLELVCVVVCLRADQRHHIGIDVGILIVSVVALVSVLLLIGILLVIIAMPTNNRGQQQFDVGSTSTEGRLEDILSRMNDVGEVHVMITYNEETVEGIAVVAEGGGNPIVVRNITDVVRALFNVDSHKIKVIEQKQNK